MQSGKMHRQQAKQIPAGEPPEVNKSGCCVNTRGLEGWFLGNKYKVNNHRNAQLMLAQSHPVMDWRV